MVPLLLLTVGHQLPTCALEHSQPRAIVAGWKDDLGSTKGWKSLPVENRVKVQAPKHGLMRLSLGHVVDGWPYEYQWSGVTKDVRGDIGRYPALMARLVDVQGYTHLDIEVLDAQGKVTKSMRSSTLTAPGLCTIDLSKHLDPAVYRLRLRLIVGGPNEGCSSTYDWIRFLRPSDAEQAEKEAVQNRKTEEPRGSSIRQ